MKGAVSWWATGCLGLKATMMALPTCQQYCLHMPGKQHPQFPFLCNLAETLVTTIWNESRSSCMPFEGRGAGGSPCCLRRGDGSLLSQLLVDRPFLVQAVASTLGHFKIALRKVHQIVTPVTPRIKSSFFTA